MGVCLDTCHVFAAGYDLRNDTAVASTLDQFESIIGLDKLFVLHANDSKGELNGGRDRHEHIGQGFIGENGFNSILRHKHIRNIPIILETPNTKTYGDKENFRKILELAKL
ncbi:MAG: TIM barrel protein [Candidatus Kariarchaeaceae archaeon]|jgi:deoxyribonuclease-4